MAASSTTTGTVEAENVLLVPTNVDKTMQNGPRRWERPWSVQEMHAEAGSWTLAGDAGLLQHLQEFSQRMISSTHHIGKEVDGLVHDAKLMDVRVNNVINDFIMLANKQFVENRVYDEDVSQELIKKEEKKIQQEKTKEEREAELIPKVSLALKLGVNVIENAFEKLDPRVVDSDSEDEDNSYVAEPILEAKDPYVTRPLPFLIGTPQFMEDDNVGLVEKSDEEADSDQGSISESEDEESEGSETEYSASEESGAEDRTRTTTRKHRTQGKSSGSFDSSDDDSDEDMFAARSVKSSDGAGSGDISASEEDVETDKGGNALLAGGPRDLAAELSARLGTDVPKHTSHREECNGENDLGETLTRHKTSSLKQPEHINKEKKEKMVEKTRKSKHPKNVDESKDDDLFGQGDGQEDDVLFAKEGGLFSSSKGLFDDDDDRGDLFEGTKKPAAKTEKSKSREDSLFSDNLVDKEAEEQKVLDSRPRTMSGKLVPQGGVSIFGVGKDITPLSKPDTSSTHTIKKPTPQPASLSSKGGQRGGLFDDSEEEDDLFSGASKKVDPVQKENRDTSKKKSPSELKKSDLFIDDEEDLFESMAASATNTKKLNKIGVTVEGYDEEGKVEERKLEDEQLKKKVTPQKKLPPGAVSMFGKGPNPVVAALKKQQQTPSSDEEESLGWSEDDKNSRSSSVHSTSSTTVKPVEATKIINSRASSIFVDDREDDDLFHSTPKFDSKTSSETDISVASSTKNAASNLDRKKSDKIIKDSLFNTSGGDEDDLIFGSVTKTPESKKPGKDVTLFEEDDDDDVVITKKDKEEPTKLFSQSANKKRGNTLFNDKVEETAEPLFPSKPPQTAGGKKTSENKTQGLFAHDDLLFGSSQDEDPSVDLFGSKTSLIKSSQTKETPKQSLAVPSKKATPTSKPATTNLFGGDDDDDDDDGGDLFSVGQLTKSPPATSAMKTITGITKTESAVTEEAKDQDKNEVKGHKKPAGAVSMFGGTDPSVVLKSRKPTLSLDEDTDEKPEKKDERKTEEVRTPAKISVSKPNTSSGLFGVDDDDDDDLFAPIASVGRAVEGTATKETADAAGKETITSKPELPKHWKPAGAVSMFGGIEPSGLLKEKVLEPHEEKTDEGNEKERSLPPQLAPKPKVLPKVKQDDNIKFKYDNITPKDGNITPKDGNITPTSLHGKGFFEGDADTDDVFGVTKKHKTPPPTAPKTPPSTAPKTPPASLPKPPATVPHEALKHERQPMSPDPVRPKILAGAVSMFGGIDPFAGMKKKSLSSEKDEDRVSSPQKEKTVGLPLFIDPLSALTSSVTMATTQTKPAPHGTVPKGEVNRSPIIDPTTLLPGATSPDLERSIKTSGSVDFDHPGETEILSSANKDRPKLNRRRPQSRKARVQAAATTDTGIEIVTPTSPRTPTTPTTPTLHKPSSVQELPPSGSLASADVTVKEAPYMNHIRTSPEISPQPKHIDLFGNDDLLDGLLLSTEKSLSAGRQRISNDDELFSKDLFGGKNTKLSNGDSKDLFSDLSKHEVTVSAESQVTIKPAAETTIVSKQDKSEDLFRKQEVITTTGSKATGVKSNAGKNMLANKDDLEDLFSNSKGKAQTSQLPTVLKQDDVHSATPGGSQVTLTTELEDDDLFASSVKSSSTAKSKLVSGTVKEDDLFSASKPNLLSKGDNPTADGLKGIKTSDDVKKGRSKRAVTKEGNLLSDSTDIFSDIPTSMSREPKRKVTKKASEKNPFKGDIDDIFADTSAATIKHKKEVKKKVVQSAVTTDNIFDDPLS